ncbi:uncharacterized protein LOC143360373 isoform X2 [Halictus rubicundus]|uniref:uncharacterized protein LOC143360373 isoform X2 n=1 Tax=Halictus rubicundus TaxID=77578 RepID=UPI0040350946
MEVFEGNLKFYHTLTCFTGLWPSDRSILRNIQRFVVLLMTITCILTQMMTARNEKMALDNIIVLLSFACTLLLYFGRYFCTLLTFPLMRFLYEHMQKDYDEVKNNPVELELLMEDSITAKRIIQVYFCMVCTGGLCLLATLGVSSLLNSDMQLHFLNLLGYFYKEKSLQSCISCWHIIFTTVYRLKTAVETAVFSGTIKELDIRSAMEMHCRAISCVHKYVQDLFMIILVLVAVTVVGFGVNLYRFYMNVTDFTDKDALMLSIHFVVTYMTFIYGNNSSGQIMLNASADLHNDTYSTLWYLLPPRMQKMVLFTMLRSQTAIEINCAGLYVGSHEGITVVTDTICIITYTLFKMIALSWTQHVFFLFLFASDDELLILVLHSSLFDVVTLLFFSPHRKAGNRRTPEFYRR